VAAVLQQKALRVLTLVWENAHDCTINWSQQQQQQQQQRSVL
jgi:hypothetical protein